MNQEITPEEIKLRYLALDAIKRQIVLSVYMHWLTVEARMYFYTNDIDRARSCNETIHRTTGHMSSQLSRHVESDAESFIAMIVVGAKHRGWTQLLVRSMRSVEG